MHYSAHSSQSSLGGTDLANAKIPMKGSASALSLVHFPIESGMPRLELLKEGKANRIAFDYWDGHKDQGSWIWTKRIKTIANQYGVEIARLPAIVSEIARAYDPKIRCIHCNEQRRLFDRRDLECRVDEGFTCDACNRAKIAELRLQIEGSSIYLAQTRFEWIMEGFFGSPFLAGVTEKYEMALKLHEHLTRNLCSREASLKRREF